MPESDQGITGDRYMLVPRVLIFIRRDDSVLLIKGASSKRLWAGKFNGIGGHVERGEDVLAAARRELLEETGLSAVLWLCGTVIVDASPTAGVGMYIFSGQFPQGEPQSSPEGTLQWTPLAALPDLPLVEDVAILLERITRMKPGDPPFAARSYYDACQRLTVQFSD